MNYFKYFNKIIILIFFSTNLNGYILITDIGGDIDDVFALQTIFHEQTISDKNVLPEAIITTHNKPIEKAQIAKLISIKSGYPNIPVYVGHGLDASYSKQTFNIDNPLWPAFFGYLNPLENEKECNPKQGDAYRNVYGTEFDDVQNSLIRGRDSAIDLLIDVAKQHRLNNEKLDIVATGPLHDLYYALLKVKRTDGEEGERIFADSINLWAMGGDYPAGYNWLIAPHVTDYVLKRIETTCVPSELIRKYALNVTTNEFNFFIRCSHKTEFAQAILQDWKNWNEDDQLKNDKNLCDPVTVYLFLHQEYILSRKLIKTEFTCLDENNEVKAGLRETAYCARYRENQITNFREIIDGENSKVSFICELNNPELLRRKLVHKIANIFYPGIPEDAFWVTMDF
ncbi:MAG: nucleoside hydrolase [Candidatus Babeliales bacterium]